MKAIYFIVLCIICFYFRAVDAQTDQITSDPATISLKSDQKILIAFGSCNKVDLPQPLWKEILKNNPDLFIWTGDNIYSDSKDMGVIEAKYQAQLDVRDYKKIMESMPVIGIWDDHDYGKDNAGKEFPMKKESRDLALDFLRVNKSNPVWEREGMYQSYMLGDNAVKIILLDTRYFRDRLVRIGNSISVNEGGDILGEDQWAWLDQELRKDEGQKMTLIVSSIQIISQEHAFEKWSNFPRARTRLFELLHYSGAPNVVFVSGDRHMGEISTMEYKGKNYYEITSSGLTHIRETITEEVNKYRRGQVINELNFGVIGISTNSKGKTQYVLQLKGEKNRMLQGLEIYFD